MSVQVLTHTNQIIVRRLITPITIIDPSTGKEIPAKGVWDTGATGSAITEKKAKELGLIQIGIAEVGGVHGKKRVPVYNVRIRLNNENIEVPTRASECTTLDDNDPEVGVLIGMDIITKGDLSISNYQGKTTLTFRCPSLENIDYVSEVRMFNKCIRVHEANVKMKRDDKCYCGSGKQFKNCHGLSKYNQ